MNVNQILGVMEFTARIAIAAKGEFTSAQKAQIMKLVPVLACIKSVKYMLLLN